VHLSGVGRGGRCPPELRVRAVRMVWIMSTNTRRSVLRSVASLSSSVCHREPLRGVGLRWKSMAHSAFGRMVASLPGGRAVERAWHANTVFDSHRDDLELGYRLMADEARRHGHRVCDRTVWRICRENQWWPASRKPTKRKGVKPGTDLSRWSAEELEAVATR
jgi:hypothetical protein